MMMARTRVWLQLPVALIVTLAAACDNVTWGGADAVVVPPPAKTGAAATASVDSLAATRSRLPRGPVLYYVRDTRHTTFMVPIAEVAGDSLRALEPAPDAAVFDSLFAAQFLGQGAHFTAYRGGERVGTFIVSAVTPPDSALCPALPIARGQLELVRSAQADTEFLAMAEAHAVKPLRVAMAGESIHKIRQDALVLAEQLLRARDAKLPSNWYWALKEVTPFPVSGAAQPGFSATLIVGGLLRVGPDHVGTSLYFVAMPRADASYDTAFVRFHDYANTGKVAVRTIDYLDWNGDGRVELVTEGLGAHATWFGALAPTVGGWRSVFDGRCAAGSAIPTTLPALPSAVPAGSAAPGGR